MDWLCESRLLECDADLHGRFSACVISMESMLNRYTAVFPTYTDHSMLHCMDVIAFLNQMLGPSGARELNADELYVLLMSALTHDVGMGVSDKQLDEFMNGQPALKDWLDSHPNEPRESLARRFHHELSYAFVKKYANMLDLPNERYAEAVAQVARGHRQADLFNEREYPAGFEVAPGRKVCLPYLAALLRLADELDIGSSRNLKFMFDVSLITNNESITAFNTHSAIRRVDIKSDVFIVETRASNRAAYFSALQTVDKLREVLDYCVKLVDERTPFTIKQREIIHNILLRESALTIDQLKLGDRLMVSLTGKLNSETAAEFSEALNSLIDGVTHLVLDLYMLTELGSDGMRVMLGMHKYLSGRGGGVTISRPPDSIVAVLRASGFYDLFMTLGEVTTNQKRTLVMKKRGGGKSEA